MIVSAEELCELIDEFPGVLPEVASVMKTEVRKGKCPLAVRTSLHAIPVTMFEIPDGLYAALRGGKNNLDRIPKSGASGAAMSAGPRS